MALPLTGPSRGGQVTTETKGRKKFTIVKEEHLNIVTKANINIYADKERRGNVGQMCNTRATNKLHVDEQPVRK